MNTALLKDISQNNMTPAGVTRRYSAWKNEVFPIIHRVLYRIFVKEDKFPPLQERCHFVSVSEDASQGVVMWHNGHVSREAHVNTVELLQIHTTVCPQ